ncbi:uncharacterized protein LOC128558434 [Mercenaria mercenaria]|uniref:uncharacterized protein LOC128558434 n=1 Tax=Mercenaria mercenaria TaxID=6596 RepID=UPI00234F4FAF|nr:uncharacterized protein LOC128558434 [Mercenaria mercenaria]
MFGRQARLVGLPKKEPVNCDLTKKMFDSFNETRQILNNAIAEYIKKAQARQKENYDKRNSSYKVILPGSRLLIKNANKIRRFGSKLAQIWVDPYIITETLSKGRVRLMNQSSNKMLSNVYHTSNLKIYTAKSKATETCPEETNQQIKKQPKKRSRSVRHRKRSLKKLRSRKKQTMYRSPYQVRHRFSPPSEKENQNMCELVQIQFSQQPPYRPSRLAKNPVRVQNIKGDGNCFLER